MPPPELPPLDCHAHIAPDVTPRQVAALNGAVVFAVTRSPAEARAAARRQDTTLVWGWGAHPNVPAALASVTPDTAAAGIAAHVLVGEIGLDRRGPTDQHAAFDTVLAACQDQSVLLSVHSTGRTRQVLDALRQQPHAGTILHWFNGTPDEIAEAVDLGFYFSVNNAMTDQRLAAVPRDRMLPETDFPASRTNTLAARPGDTTALEQRLADRDGTDPATVRAAWYRNLGRLAAAAGADARLPARLQQHLTVAAQRPDGAQTPQVSP